MSDNTWDFDHGHDCSQQLLSEIKIDNLSYFQHIISNICYGLTIIFFSEY